MPPYTVTYSPNVRVATKTMQAINAAIEADQGSAFRGWLQKVLPHIGDAYRQNDTPFRSHLGASILGDECKRKIWYNFRWAVATRFSGRILRLFNRGHLEEARIISCLLMIGVKVFQQDTNGKQYRISFAGGHGGGSGDGVGIGIPDLDPETACLLEFKTHNEKSFKMVSEQGVRAAKFEHYVQMQLYMRRMGLAIALYVASNKNDDDLYMELVPLNPEMADQYVDLGTQIIFSPTPPKKLNESAGFFKCKWCDARNVCHKVVASEPMHRNCRTCRHSAPLQSGEWYCNMHAKVLSEEEQLRACATYEVIQQ